MMQPRPRIAAADPPPFAPVALTIQCGGEWFGLPISHVYTVFHIGVVTPVPLAPADILGLTNLRGLIVTVVSLRGRLGMPVRPLSEESLAVAVRHAGENYALLVDRVADVVDLAASRPIQRQPHLDPSRSALTSQVYRLEGRTVPMLDVAALLTFAAGHARSTSHPEH